MSGIRVMEKMRQKYEIPDYWSKVGLDDEILVISNCEISAISDNRKNKGKTNC